MWLLLMHPRSLSRRAEARKEPQQGVLLCDDWFIPHRPYQEYAAIDCQSLTYLLGLQPRPSRM